MKDKEKKLISYILEGKAFDEGYSIYELNTALTEFEFILERAYLSLAGKQNMMSKDRKTLKIVSKKFEQGSFLSDWELILVGTQMTFSIFNQMSPSEIWDLTRNTFDFLKIIFSSKNENIPVNINIGDNNNKVTVETGNKYYEFNGPVYKCAKDSIHHYRNLTNLIEQG